MRFRTLFPMMLILILVLAFAFPGSVGDVAGIWRQDLAGGDPVRVAGGAWVAWSSD